MKKLFCTLLAILFCLSIISVPTGARAAQPKLEKPVFMVALPLGETFGFQEIQDGLDSMMHIHIYMTHPNKDAQIFFTRDGSTPNKNSEISWEDGSNPRLYVTDDVTFKAIAYADGYEPSDVATFTYKRTKGKPNSWQLVKIGSSKQWLYFDKDGKAVEGGWIKDKGKWYLFGLSYTLITNGWFKYSGQWYYFDSSGAMQVGWIKNGGKWYYLQASGAMKTGWLEDKGKWYYLQASGAMKTGWLLDRGCWWFLNDDGSRATGWLKRPEGWYYLMPNGKMATSGKEMGDIHQMFNANGLWIGVAG